MASVSLPRPKLRARRDAPEAARRARLLTAHPLLRTSAGRNQRRGLFLGYRAVPERVQVDTGGRNGLRDRGARRKRKKQLSGSAAAIKRWALPRRDRHHLAALLRLEAGVGGHRRRVAVPGGRAGGASAAQIVEEGLQLHVV